MQRRGREPHSHHSCQVPHTSCPIPHESKEPTNTHGPAAPVFCHSPHLVFYRRVYRCLRYASTATSAAASRASPACSIPYIGVQCHRRRCLQHYSSSASVARDFSFKDSAIIAIFSAVSARFLLAPLEQIPVVPLHPRMLMLPVPQTLILLPPLPQILPLVPWLLVLSVPHSSNITANQQFHKLSTT